MKHYRAQLLVAFVFLGGIVAGSHSWVIYPALLGVFVVQELLAVLGVKARGSR